MINKPRVTHKQCGSWGVVWTGSTQHVALHTHSTWVSYSDSSDDEVWGTVNGPTFTTSWRLPQVRSDSSSRDGSGSIDYYIFLRVLELQCNRKHHNDVECESESSIEVTKIINLTTISDSSSCAAVYRNSIGVLSMSCVYVTVFPISLVG